MTQLLHPIKPDFIKNVWGPGSGVLGMVFAPGRNRSSQPTIIRNIGQDIQTLKQQYKAQTILSLLEDVEYARMKLTEEEHLCQRYSIKFMRYPILDRSIPNDLLSFKRMVQIIVDQEIKKDQKTVIVHCAAGLGRTGLFAASCLKYIGNKTEEAVSLVRRVRPGTIEVESQMNFLQKLQFP